MIAGFLTVANVVCVGKPVSASFHVGDAEDELFPVARSLMGSSSQSGISGMELDGRLGTSIGPSLFSQSSSPSSSSSASSSSSSSSSPSSSQSSGIEGELIGGGVSIGSSSHSSTVEEVLVVTTGTLMGAVIKGLEEFVLLHVDEVKLLDKNLLAGMEGLEVEELV